MSGGQLFASLHIQTATLQKDFILATVSQEDFSRNFRNKKLNKRLKSKPQKVSPLPPIFPCRLQLSPDQLLHCKTMLDCKPHERQSTTVPGEVQEPPATESRSTEKASENSEIPET
ncbi:hypothetical protein Ancab_010610, partial [Ancistrocladus abbreviatus]